MNKRKENKTLKINDNFKKQETKISELDYIHVNFAFCISDQKCEITYYNKLYEQLKRVSYMTKREFMELGKNKSGNIKLEKNIEIINRQKSLNVKYINFRNKSNIKYEFTTTYDFLRSKSNLWRAYGELHDNILYVLELDPQGISRKH